MKAIDIENYWNKNKVPDKPFHELFKDSITEHYKSLKGRDAGLFLVDMNKVDEVITISTEEAKERSLQLAKENGLFVGISSGANVLASERWIEKNKPNGVVVTILCDRGERYFSIL